MAKFALLAIFTVLQIADVVTTNHALAMSGLTERNPVMMASMDHLGALWWLPKLALVLYIAVILRRMPRMPAWPLGALAGMNLAVVANNLAFII